MRVEMDLCTAWRSIKFQKLTLQIVDSMSFDHGWTELDLVDEREAALDEKGTKKLPKGRLERKIRVHRSIATL
jgi:hypothetical protein